MTKRIPLSLALVLLAGCDFVYGVHRRAKIPAPPDLQCVEKVIRKAPGVEKVDYSKLDGGRPITWTGLQPETEVHAFVYRDGQVLGLLQITVRYDGETTFSQALRFTNRKPTQEQIDATRPVMQWIEEELAKQCGMDGLVTSIVESCSGVECPPLGKPPSP